LYPRCFPSHPVPSCNLYAYSKGTNVVFGLQLYFLFITFNLLGAYNMSQFMCPNCGVSIGTETYSVHSYLSLPPNILNSNNAMDLSGHMRSQYSKTIAGIETNLSKLDDEMSQLQMVMGQLAVEHQSLERSLEEHRSIVVLIRRIPLELLSGIFIFCGFRFQLQLQMLRRDSGTNTT
jgi:hypothetical protein